MELTSIDYARLVQYTAFRQHRTLLNKTQVNKILFYIYGAYYADTGKLLFQDDKAQVWTYGPVFPRSNKRFISGEIISSFSEDTVKAFKEDNKALSLTIDVVNTCIKLVLCRCQSGRI